MVHPQVGQAGYFIDLAIAHPTKPGRMVLGIECDGATYHSSRSAQERDRLRQSHLESMGWRIHRIWSTDWFRNPKAALEAAEAAISEAIAYYDAPAATADEEPPTPPVLPARTDETAQDVQEPEPLEPEAVLEHREYEPAVFKLQPEGDLHAVPTARLTRWLNRIITVEGPVHPNIAARRLASNYGITRMGNRIQSAIANAIDHGVNTGKFTLQHGDSLTSSSTQARSITLRNRAHLHGDDRKIENVPTTELNAGIKQILSAAHGVTAAELIQEIAAQLGYDRVTQQIRGSLNDHLKALESKKLLIWDPATDIVRWSKLTSANVLIGWTPTAMLRFSLSCPLVFRALRATW